MNMSRLITKKQVAERLSCCVRTVERMVQARLLPRPVTVGVGIRRPRRRWREAEVEQALKLGQRVQDDPVRL